MPLVGVQHPQRVRGGRGDPGVRAAADTAAADSAASWCRWRTSAASASRGSPWPPAPGTSAAYRLSRSRMRTWCQGASWRSAVSSAPSAACTASALYGCAARRSGSVPAASASRECACSASGGSTAAAGRPARAVSGTSEASTAMESASAWKRAEPIACKVAECARVRAKVSCRSSSAAARAAPTASGAPACVGTGPRAATAATPPAPPDRGPGARPLPPGSVPRPAPAAASVRRPNAGPAAGPGPVAGSVSRQAPWGSGGGGSGSSGEATADSRRRASSRRPSRTAYCGSRPRVAPSQPSSARIGSAQAGSVSSP